MIKIIISKRSSVKLIFFLILLIFFYSGCCQKQIDNDNTKVFTKYYGFCYSPFRDNENPDLGIFPTIEELYQDLPFVAKFTERIRIYGNSNTLGEIAAISDHYGLECYAGAWISKDTTANDLEINGLLRIANLKLKTLKGLIVGNEVILRNDMNVHDLSMLIKKLNDSTDIPIGTAETWSVLEQNPEIVTYADFILVHIHPYWDAIDVEKAAEKVANKYFEIKQLFPNKLVIIGETGWPSNGETFGDAIPSEENQKKFFEQFITLAKEQDIPYFYFDVFDEGWKGMNEGEIGENWGLFKSNGTLKPFLYPFFSSEVQKGINRSPK
jgi:exo-beta-1,3-glucanase (GH17 family)